MLLLLLLLIPCTASALQCYSCGVFLSAPTSDCKGEPTAMNCTSSRSPVGCVYINGKNMDNTYYVEKRCASIEERKMADGECVDVVVEGATKATKCFCTSDLCNSTHRPSFTILLLFAVLGIKAICSIG